MQDKKGYLVISLDFELFWGVFDVRELNSYRTNIDNVRAVVPRLIELANNYNIALTFATVGFLFNETKEELLESCPNVKPNYKNSKFNPYEYIRNIGDSEKTDPYHYASTLIETIKNNPQHEIGTHTFSHYYCNEAGQTVQDFEEDLLAAIRIANKKNIPIKSIVFPRNQINKNYLNVCKKHGVTCYRGTENHWMFNTYDTNQLEKPFSKAFRLMDAYLNISGYNTYNIENLKDSLGMVNIPSSKFLRPYSKSLKFLEKTRVNRIKKGLSKAAKNNELYHIWWHPHNFGENTEENFKLLEDIFKHYKKLNNTHNYKSVTMSELANIITN
ncbi:polysaccharide deacetylase family protein [Corallibacter sp.]|uniref:polysaccharide deacetylase family protein n=1 Tax=Corallibacter sp. TaxID=2038084 RepID=UPI003A93A646